MTDKILYWVTTVFAGLALLLFIANACLINGNQRIQENINGRQNVINTAMNVQPLNQQLSQAIFESAIKNNDGQLRELLTSQGFTLPNGQPAAADKAPEKAGPNKAKKED